MATTDRLIPLGVWFSEDNFYSLEHGRGMGNNFYNLWKDDAVRFPKSKSEAQLHAAANMQQSIPNPRAERPTPAQMLDAITVLFDMAAKQANPTVRMSYVQTGAWLRDIYEGRES